MASLLDLVVAQKNPQLAGLLGVNPQQGAQTAQRAVSSPAGGQATPVTPANAPAGGAGGGGGGVGRALGDIFAGQRDPSLSPDANQAARRQALITAGLAILASEREGLAAVAEGGLTGQAVGQQARAQAVQDAEEEQLLRARAQILQSSDLSRPEGRIGAIRDLLSIGLAEDAQKLINLTQTFESPQLLEAGDRVRIFDPNTLEIKETDVRLPGPPRNTSWQQVGENLQLRDDETGELITSIRNPERLSASDLQSQAKDRVKLAQSLRKEFESVSGSFQEAIALADAALQGPEGDPATGQSLIIALNKILDPDSVVRQSEFQRVEEIGGATARLQGLRNRLEQGQLPEQTEAAVRAEIARLRRAMREELAKRADFFVANAQDAGINPDRVVRQDIQDFDTTDKNPFNQ